MDKTVYILGVGRNTIVTIDLAESCGYTIGGLFHYLDDRTGEDYFGHRIIGSNRELFTKDLNGMSFAISVGDNTIRFELYNRILQLGGNIPLLIHPTAVISKYSKVRAGSQIYAYSVIDPNTVIEENTIISSKSCVLHGCRIGKNCFLAPDAVLGANTVVEDFTMIGLNATIISNKANMLGSHSVIGASAVVTKPVEKNKVVAGIPARELQKIK
jgi:UDP-perosamine 4-acetyltransferase